jgi:ROS/MUCR transcriptional regulator protein
MLNPSKKELLAVRKWIQSRAVKKLPLNIHVVRRERPELLAIAYAGQTPRGWRRCLLDADVSPYDIEHELEEVIPCLICGKELSVLGRHLLDIHSVDKNDYRQEFGASAKLASESYRAAHSRMPPYDGCPPHWEKLWSAEYVIDWILLLNELGMDLNMGSINCEGSTMKSLINGALAHFGSWDHALIAAGLDPEEIRLTDPMQGWTKTNLLTEMRRLAKARKKNTTHSMSEGMRNAIRRFYGTLKKAIDAAGVEHAELVDRLNIKREETEAVVAQIRNLEKFKGLERRRELDKIYHDPKNFRVVMKAKSLKRLALKEGIPMHLVNAGAFRDAADVHHELDIMEKKGLHLTVMSLIKQGHSRLNNVIHETGWGAERIQSTRTPKARAAKR